MRSRDPLDDLTLPEPAPGPQTPWVWMIIAVIVVAVLLWLLLARANQPAPGGVQEQQGRLLHRPAERVGHVNGRGGSVVMEEAPALGRLSEEVGGLGDG
jgi:hypothetical protein